MRYVLIFFIAQSAHAGWFKDFCERHLVAEDPYPYAEAANSELLYMFRETRSPDILKELVFRYRHEMLTPVQAREFWELIGGK